MKKLFCAALLSTLGGVIAFADVTYQETTKFTGGTLLATMQKMASNPMFGRMGGGGMKQAFEDQSATVYVKGNKLARVSARTTTIYDLDAGTITLINQEKQTYSTQTFEEMRARMQEAQQRMSKMQGGELEFDVKSSNTGKTKQIEAETAKETIITMTAKQASADGQMVVTIHAWLVPMNAARREVLDFQKKLAAKLSTTLGGSPMMGAASGGLAAAARELSRLDTGYAAESDTSITGVSNSGGPFAAMAALSGGNGNADPNAPFLETQTLHQNVAKAQVEDSHFTIPAGFTEEKGRRRGQ